THRVLPCGAGPEGEDARGGDVVDRGVRGGAGHWGNLGAAGSRHTNLVQKFCLHRRCRVRQVHRVHAVGLEGDGDLTRHLGGAHGVFSGPAVAGPHSGTHHREKNSRHRHGHHDRTDQEHRTNHRQRDRPFAGSLGYRSGGHRILISTTTPSSCTSHVHPTGTPRPVTVPP